MQIHCNTASSNEEIETNEAAGTNKIQIFETNKELKNHNSDDINEAIDKSEVIKLPDILQTIEATEASEATGTSETLETTGKEILEYNDSKNTELNEPADISEEF